MKPRKYNDNFIANLFKFDFLSSDYGEKIKRSN